MHSVAESKLRMPAEWEPHEATWISWPHQQSDWPGKLSAVRWAMCDLVRLLSPYERVEILCHNDEVLKDAQERLQRTGVSRKNFRLHKVASDRSWMRDCGPTAVIGDDDKIAWIKWKFSAWSRYENSSLDEKVAEEVSRLSGIPLVSALRPDNRAPLVLEGGGIETDGCGTLLVTEDCFLSRVQERNPGLSRADYEVAFQEYLGISKTIWLRGGYAGDDTHGHIDNVARFASKGKVILSWTDSSDGPDSERALENLECLLKAKDALGQKLEVVKLPLPEARSFDGEILPASYANFYIANGIVIVPTFNDPRDLEALQTLAPLFPDRKIVTWNSADVILGQGSIHCLSQQQPCLQA